MGVYGFCFLLSVYTNHLRAEMNNYSKNIGFMMDSGNSYAEHVRAAHAAMLHWQDDKPLHVGSLAFGNDQEIGALQAADMVAWSVRRRVTSSAFGNGFEPLLGVFDEAHSEHAWSGPVLQALSTELKVLFEK
jgi:hypothetical protein